MTIVSDNARYVEIARFSPLRQGQAIAISPSGKYLAVIGLFGRNVLIYKADGTLVRDIPRVDTYSGLSLFFHNDDEIIVPAGNKVGKDAMLEVWNVEGDAPSRVINGLYPGLGPVYNLAKEYAAANGQVAVKSNGRKSSQMTLVDLATGISQPYHLNELSGEIIGVLAVALSPDGRLFAVADTSGRILIVDTENKRILHKIPIYRSSTSIRSLAFSPDGEKIVVGEGIPLSQTQDEEVARERAQGITIWDLRDGKLLRSIETGPGIISQLSWSRDGQSIAGVKDSKSFFMLPASEHSTEAFHFRDDIPYAVSTMFAANADFLTVLSMKQVYLFKKE